MCGIQLLRITVVHMALTMNKGSVMCGTTVKMEVRFFRHRIFLIILLLSLMVSCNGKVLFNNTTNGTTNKLAKCSDQHSTILNLGAVVFWGAQTYMSTNIAHVVLCIVVVAIYICVPGLRCGLHNRAVVRHNICVMMHGIILQILGICELVNCQINNYLMIFLWLCLQYFTIAAVFWLNVISYNMTLSITRFRWIAGNTKKNNPDEDRRLFSYGLFAWVGSMAPTLLAGLCDYIPGVPKEFLLKPNYVNFRNGQNLVVNMYFFAVPTFTLLLNNILFVYTTYRIIKIQRSTQIATRNKTNLLKKKYFLFLRLYLLMGAPWFFGMLLACFNKLIILKTCRLIQPSLWLLILATHPAVVKKIKQWFMCHDYRQRNIFTIST